MKPIESRTSFHLCSPELVASSTRSSTAQRRTSLTATYATLRRLACSAASCASRTRCAHVQPHTHETRQRPTPPPPPVEVGAAPDDIYAKMYEVLKRRYEAGHISKEIYLEMLDKVMKEEVLGA